MFNKNFLAAAAVVIALTPGSAFAAWVLDGAESSINIVSVKKGKAGEVHSFKTLSGNVTDDGVATVNIELGSVETGIPIRNTRMGTMLFEIEKFPLAKISAKLDAEAFKSQAVGTRMAHEIVLTVDLHGVSKEISAGIYVTRLSKTMVNVASAKPIIIKAGKFGLKGGIKALKKAANLPSIATAVPTTFNLVFKDQ